MDLHWKIDSESSCFYAIDCLLSGSGHVSPDVRAAIEPAAQAIHEFANVNAMSLPLLLTHFVPQAAQSDQTRRMAGVLLAKAAGGRVADHQTSYFSQLLQDVQESFRKACATSAEQLADNSRALREDWGQYDQAFVEHVSESTEREVLVDRAEVLLVHPVCGGSGRAYLVYNQIAIEAVENDRTQQLPEVLRLMWLLAQLNADLPMYQGEIHRDRLTAIVELAMIPVVLEVGSKLSLIDGGDLPIQLAVTEWSGNPSDTTAIADAVGSWWQTYQSQRPRWEVALAALDRLVGES